MNEHANVNLSIVVATADNNIIGDKNKLLWHIPEDLKRFKKLTLGHSIIMGRKTYESLPKKPLPGRENIILSTSISYIPDCIIKNSYEQVLLHVQNKEESFVIGGGEIYRLFFPYVKKIYLTRLNEQFSGDTSFPEISETDWEVMETTPVHRDGTSGFTFSYITYIRKK